MFTTLYTPLIAGAVGLAAGLVVLGLVWLGCEIVKAVFSDEEPKVTQERQRINRYTPGLWSNIKDWICDRFGHRRVWGPAKKSGATCCVFCNTFLGYRRFGKIESLIRKLDAYTPKDGEPKP